MPVPQHRPSELRYIFAGPPGGNSAELLINLPQYTIPVPAAAENTQNHQAVPLNTVNDKMFSVWMDSDRRIELRVFPGDFRHKEQSFECFFKGIEVVISLTDRPHPLTETPYLFKIILSGRRQPKAIYGHSAHAWKP